jgi:hypothetical protein
VPAGSAFLISRIGDAITSIRDRRDIPHAQQRRETLVRPILNRYSTFQLTGGVEQTYGKSARMIVPRRLRAAVRGCQSPVCQTNRHSSAFGKSGKTGAKAAMAIAMDIQRILHDLLLASGAPTDAYSATRCWGFLYERQPIKACTHASLDA